MRRSRRSTLRKNLRRRAAAAAEQAPETILSRRLRFTAERLIQAKRALDLTAEALSLAALFSGLARGLVVRRARSGLYVVAARRELGACTDAERKTVEAAARLVLVRRRPILDAREPAGVLLALPLEHEGELLGAIVLHGPARATPLDACDRATLLGLARQTARALARLRAEAQSAATEPAFAQVSGWSRTRSC